MNSKALLTALAFVVLCILSMWWYKSNVICNCGGAVTTTGNTTDNTANTTAAATLPYYFKGVSGKNIMYDSRFAAYADSVKSSLGADESLLIKGLWYNGEDTMGIGDLGLYRANRLKDTLSKFIDPARMSVISQFINNANADSIYYGALIEKALKPKLSSDSTTSVLQNGELIVYFPSNSTKNIFDAATEKNINDIVAQAKAGKNLSITGHTDAQGDDKKNLVLGLNRANKLKDILVSRGTAATQITTESKGEAEPVATNETAEGRAINRRAVVKIN
jgi:outer membrane protein OmpA-like peptidoglycan-associated protein